MRAPAPVASLANSSCVVMAAIVHRAGAALRRREAAWWLWLRSARCADGRSRAELRSWGSVCGCAGGRSMALSSSHRPRAVMRWLDALLAVPASISSVRGVFDGTHGRSRARRKIRPSGWRTLGRPVRARAWPAGSCRGGFMHTEVARPRYPAGALLRTTWILTSGTAMTPLLRFERVAGTGRPRRRVPGVILSPDILPEHLPDEAGVDVRIRYRAPVLRGSHV